jgi:hypothetical protein
MAHDPLRIAPLMPERSPLEAHVLMPIHAYRLVSPDSPPAPEMLWEWEGPSIDRLLWDAKTFGREVVQRSFADWDAFAEENRRIWEIYYLPRPAYQPWDTWQAWVRAYRELVRDVQDSAEEHHDRLRNNRRPVRRAV